MDKDFYLILGVHRNAEESVIRDAYKALAQNYHPDKWRGNKAEADKRMSEINVAYGVLSDASKRRQYDLTRNSTERDNDHNNSDHGDNDLVSLDGISGYEFEELVAKILQRSGYVDVNVTQKSGDLGKDIIMKDTEGSVVVVECKHNATVGRPVIQKLQGAMLHEGANQRDAKILGMVVTSGKFSAEAREYAENIRDLQKIELIDGKQLKRLCDRHGLKIVNGRIQVITNSAYRNIVHADARQSIEQQLLKIYGANLFTPKINLQSTLVPVCLVRYRTSFDTYTSVGLVDSHNSKGAFLVNGESGLFYGDAMLKFYADPKSPIESLNPADLANAAQFSFTEQELEDRLTSAIIRQETHTVSYVGRNNVTYYKECAPGKKDISIESTSLYAPIWRSTIELGRSKYAQHFAVNGDRTHYHSNQLLDCTLCKEKPGGSQSRFACSECGGIVCSDHSRLDYLDKTTAVCKPHAKAYRIFLQKKYFANDETRTKYSDWLAKRPFLVKLYEDKVVVALLVLGLVISALFTLIPVSEPSVAPAVVPQDPVNPTQKTVHQRETPHHQVAEQAKAASVQSSAPAPVEAPVPAISDPASIPEKQPTVARASVPIVTSNRFWTPSFGCISGISATEAAICADEHLSLLDKMSAYENNTILPKYYNRVQIQNVQHSWMTSNRDTCGEDAQCLATAYRTKLGNFEISSMIAFMKANGWDLKSEAWKVPDSCTQKFARGGDELTISYVCSRSRFDDVILGVKR